MLWILDMMRRAALARHEMLVRLTVPESEREAAYRRHHKFVNDIYLPLMTRHG